MKVKIVTPKDCWYSDKVGEIYEVELNSCQRYRVKEGGYKDCCIDAEHAEIVTENIKIPFTFSAWDKDRSQKVWTRYGREVKQLTYFESSDYSFAGVINGELEIFTKEGFALIGGKESPKDLFLEHTEKEYFVNVYRRANGTLYTKSADCHDSYNDASGWAGQSDNFVKTISFKA